MSQQEQPSSKDKKELPLIIYQNTHFTDSLISIIEDGLSDSQSEEKTNQNNQHIHGEAGLNSDQLLQFLISTKFEGTGDLAFKQLSSTQKDIKITDSLRFSKIKNHLHGNKQLQSISQDEDFNNLELGQFVEFDSSYKKNEIRELLELLTDDNSFELLWTLYQKHEKEKKEREQEKQSNNNDKKSNKNKSKPKNNNKDKEYYKNLFKTIRNILTIDFPPESTSLDFYGQIEATSIQNVLICDTKFFVQEDKNRILDGKFKVLGKVLDIQNESNPEETVTSYFSQLDRNKLLKRVTPDALEQFQTLLSHILKEFKSEEEQGKEIEWFDNQINLQLTGKVLKVLPIIIYR